MTLKPLDTSWYESEKNKPWALTEEELKAQDELITILNDAGYETCTDVGVILETLNKQREAANRAAKQ